jgi:6-phosphogluconate dehydrogenase (decarboxylating)
MQVAKIGLSRLGTNMVRRLLEGGHQCLLFDMSPNGGWDPGGGNELASKSAPQTPRRP